ncbi:RNA polymerase-binding protein DksA [Kordiimonas marina]|uniref:RNA polymerase-binding protein DksA n=1 Tax=Kordiimonas marina TaxID=2872312 RepID=UPI001FF6D6E0|nr:RNA polymerase-binding protein DksA [Kordiimonas marina]MCJ9430336.1 RNA polymerase-binding protein DksA [Kordiimonas marina]
MTNTMTKPAKEITLPDGYLPSPDEDFMNPLQLEYFRRKLINWKEDILRESAETLQNLQEDNLREPDIADRASSETDWSVELRTRDRQRKLVAKIDSALRRIETGEYGYCEVTGEPISLRRLDARPIATMTIEAQEAHERAEKVHRED